MSTRNVELGDDGAVHLRMITNDDAGTIRKVFYPFQLRFRIDELDCLSNTEI